MGTQLKAGESGGFHDLTTLLVASEQDLCEKISALLGAHCHHVITSKDAGEGLNILADEKPELVVVDLSDSNDKVMRLLRASREVAPTSKVLALVAKGDMDQAVAAIKGGAYDCLVKPLEPEHLLNVAKRAIEEIEQWIHREADDNTLGYWSDGKVIVGRSAPMREIWERIDMVRDVTSNVLIQGETGTGKELVAHAIHHTSPRADGPFVKLNCGAIPKDLLESELFGHEKGAFTGALQQRIGRFEMADGGTILLDEIGDMPADLQVKLLGVIQDRFVQRVGGHEKIPVDVRVLAATHQNLQEAIEQGDFREDLYYRLNVITIRVPALRHRREDIPLLVRHFVRLYKEQTGRDVSGVSAEAMDILRNYNYPGNVRQLENIIESCVVLCQGDKITPRDLPRDMTIDGDMGPEFIVRPGMSLDEVERRCIIETLRYTEGNKKRAAELLGITPRSIYRKLKSYDIETDAILSGAQ
jgi:two-component system response regulator HydG